MKLKYIVCMTLGLSLLGGCYSFKVDDAEGRAGRIAERKAENGCTLLETQKEYRDCVIATAQKNSPKTYTTAENSDGEAIAIIKGEKPCTNQCAERWKAKHSTEILEEVESETIIEQTPKQTVVIQEAVAETIVEPILEPVPASVPVPVVIQEAVAPAPVQDKTWWEQYQKDKASDVADKVICPCPDPNDPCPQCAQK